MAHTYKKIELVGTSNEGLEDAIRTAVYKAAKTIHHMDWFEMKDVRGWIKDGEIEYFQVTVQIGFRLDDED